MSVHTTYDEMRDSLRDKLTECVKMAKEMFDENIWGYDEMKEDYIIDIYKAIKNTRDMV